LTKALIPFVLPIVYKYDDEGNCYKSGVLGKVPCTKPLDLKKRNKTLDSVIDGIECFEGNAIGCVKTLDDVVNISV
jgi:hypothetical protein